MNSAQRQEGGRGRQRRRRGGGRGGSNAEGRGRKEGTGGGGPSGSGQASGDAPPRRTGKGSGRNRRGNAGDANGTRKNAAEEAASAKAAAAEAEALRLKEAEARAEAERVEAEKREEEARKEAERLAALEKEKAEQAAKAAEMLLRRGALRASNLEYYGDNASKSRITEANLRKLDSSVKKCTAFIRKLRGSGITEDSHKALISDVRNLNLSRYISEVVTAISECKLRAADTDYAALVAAELHQRFEDFAAQLSAALATVVLCQHPNASKDLPNRRGAMRLLVELYVLGMNNDVASVTSVLRELMKAARESRDAGISNLNVAASFVRVFNRVFLVRPNPEIVQPLESVDSPTIGGHTKAELPSWEDEVTPAQTKQVITAALESYYKSDVTKLYEESRNTLREAEIAAIRARQTRGSVDDACQAKYDSAKSTCEKIFAACNTLAEALGQSDPLPVSAVSEGDGNKSSETVGAYAVVHGRGAGGRGRDGLDLEESESIFESEEDRAFYNDLPDASKPPDSSQEESKTDATAENSGSAEQVGASSSNANDAKSPSVSQEDSKQKDTTEKKEVGRSGKKKAEKTPTLDNLLARLGATETKENADRFIYQFIAVAENSRKPMQRLSKSLIAVSPQKLNVLPAYSRIAASLRQVHPEVATTVSETLEREFRMYAERTDVDEKTLSSCIKTARYVGEYCKFRMLDYEVVFSLLTYCIKELDFAGHRIDMTCHLLETCGRMIYRTPSSSIRMGNLLDTVWRLKAVKNLEPRHNTLVETAFHAARPAIGGKLQRRKERPPMQEYIRRLIYTWLTPETVRWTALQMKRLPWDEETQTYVIKKFVKVNRMKFSTIPDVANLIAAVGKYRREVLVGVVDGLLEAVRSGMERNDGRDAQRRVSEVALLGELFNANVLSERVIFYILYQFITLGHDLPPNVGPDAEASASALLNADPTGNNIDPADGLDLNLDVQARRLANTGFYLAAPDPPKDFFRVRLACTLIEACGANLLRDNKRKTQVFWSLFERYAFCKAVQAGLQGQLPLHIDHILSDAFEKMTSGNRKPLVEGNSRIRIKSKDDDRKKPSDWERAKTLQDALTRAMEVEKHPADFALITLPVRAIVVPATKKTDPNSSDAIGETNKEWSGIKANGTKPSLENASDTPPDAEDDASADSDGDMLPMEDDDEEDIDNALSSPQQDAQDDSLDEPSDNSDFDDEEDDDDDDDFAKRPKTEEEEQLERELAQIMASSVSEAKENPNRVATLNRMALPMGLMAQKRAQGSPVVAPERVGFKFLHRKGGKSQIQDLAIPASSSLAVAARESESVGAAQQEEKKRLVLESTIVLNGDDEDTALEHPPIQLRTQHDAKQKEQSIRQRRAADEAALLATMFVHKPRR